MPLTPAQRKKVQRRTTASSKARLRKRYVRQNARKPKAKPKPKRPDPLYQPGVPLAGARLRRAASKLTSLEFGEARDALGREMSQATTQGRELANRTSDYYSQLAQEEAGMVARQQAIGTELQNTLSKTGAEAQTALSTVEQEAAQRAAQDAALRGQGLSGGGQERVAAEIAAARGLAAQGTQTAQQTSALTTANWANLSNVANTARGMAGGETLTRYQNQLANTQNDIRGRRASLDRQAAAKRVGNLLELRQQGFENTLAARGLDVDLAEIQADMQQSQAANKLARARIKSAERQNKQRLAVQKRGQDISSWTQRRGQNVTAKQRAADRASRERIAKARSRGSKVEPADARKIRMGVSNALADLSSAKPKNPTRWLRRRDAPGIVAQAAAERYKYGGIRPSTAAELRRMGVRVPKGWLKVFAGPPTPL